MKRKIYLAGISEKIFEKFGIEKGVAMIATMSVTQLANLVA